MPKGVYKRGPKNYAYWDSIRGKPAKPIPNHSEYIKAGLARNGAGKKISKHLKRLWKDPEYVANWKSSRAKNKDSSNYSKAGRKKWKDPLHRKIMIAAFTGVKRSRIGKLAIRMGHNTAVARINHSKGSKKMHRDNPEIAQWTMAKARSCIKNPVKIGPSRIQLSIFRFLCRKGVSGIRSEYRVYPYWIDIAHPRKKLAIEIDGKCWHTDKARDAKRTSVLEKQGWEVHRFNAVRQSKMRVLEFLQQRGLVSAS